jgi:hypothetical protein
VHRTFIVIALGLFMAASAVNAAEQTPQGGNQLMPPWMQPDVVAAAENIGMTEAQLPQFRAYITEFTQGQLTAYVRLSRSNTMRDAARKMRGKTRTLMRRMDEQMVELLDAEQYLRYEIYRDLLSSSL